MRRRFLLGLATTTTALATVARHSGRALVVALDFGLLLLGLALIVLGVAQWSLGAACIVAGLALLAFGIMPDRPDRRRS